MMNNMNGNERRNMKKVVKVASLPGAVKEVEVDVDVTTYAELLELAGFGTDGSFLLRADNNKVELDDTVSDVKIVIKSAMIKGNVDSPFKEGDLFVDEDGAVYTLDSIKYTDVIETNIYTLAELGGDEKITITEHTLIEEFQLLELAPVQEEIPRYVNTDDSFFDETFEEGNSVFGEIVEYRTVIKQQIEEYEEILNEARIKLEVIEDILYMFDK